jgi:hypothetical protein
MSRISVALNLLHNNHLHLALDVNEELLACEPDSFQSRSMRAVLLLRLNRRAENAEKAF